MRPTLSSFSDPSDFGDLHPHRAWISQGLDYGTKNFWIGHANPDCACIVQF